MQPVFSNFWCTSLGLRCNVGELLAGQWKAEQGSHVYIKTTGEIMHFYLTSDLMGMTPSRMFSRMTLHSKFLYNFPMMATILTFTLYAFNIFHMENSTNALFSDT